MNKKVYLLVSTVLLLGFSYVSHAQASFTGGHIQSMAVCKNSGANSINTLMSVTDPSTGHTVSWSVFAAPAHGTLVAAYTTTSTGSTLTPTGLTYMPTPGYSGSDLFSVMFTDGSAIDTTDVNVTVDTVLDPGTITGPPTLCIGAHLLYSDATTGGAWSVSNTTASIDGAGTATGLGAGADTISYSFTNGCGISSATEMITVNGIPNAGTLLTPDSVCAGGHLTLMPGGAAGGVWHSGNTVSATVNDTGRVTGIAPGTSRISYIVTNGCGADTVSAEVKVQTHVLPIVLLGGDTLCQLQMLTLIDPSAGGAWTSSSFFVAAVIGGIVVGVTPGNARITYTLHNACGATTATQDVVVEPTTYCASAVNTIANEKDELNVFPNPNNGAFTINLTSGVTEPAEVFITNIVGEKVMELNTVTNQALEVKLDKPAGLYFVRVSTSNGKSYIAKLLVN